MRWLFAMGGPPLLASMGGGDLVDVGVRAAGYGSMVSAPIDRGSMFTVVLLGRRFALVWERDASGERRVFELTDVEHARRFLDTVTADERAWPVLRSLLRASPHLHGEDDLSREDLVDELARHLARRTLLVLDAAFLHGPGGGGGRIPEVPSTPPPSLAPTTFVAIELVDEEGRPVAHERYRITLPDGTVRQGRLDDRGRARVDGIRPAGACDVEFPDIHGDEWRPA